MVTVHTITGTEFEGEIKRALWLAHLYSIWKRVQKEHKREWGAVSPMATEPGEGLGVTVRVDVARYNDAMLDVREKLDYTGDA